MDKYNQILRELITNTGAEGAVLVSPDGLAIASTFSDTYDEDRAAAMAAAILSLAERVAQELNKGELQEVYIKGKDGYVLFKGVSDVAVLGVLTKQNVKLGLLLMESQRAVQKLLKEALQEQTVGI